MATGCFAAEPPGAAQPFQSQERFEEAIRDNSTSPFFILYTAVDDRTGEARKRCGTANLFRGAIHREYSLPYDKASQAKVTEIVLSSPDHVFHFTKQEALDNIPVRYSQEAIISARKMLAELNEDPILRTFGHNEAVGCALVERGQSARMGDRPSNIIALP
jgi:hypothetical protein